MSKPFREFEISRNRLRASPTFPDMAFQIENCWVIGKKIDKPEKEGYYLFQMEKC